MRKRLYWKLRDREIALGETALCGAIIPITPDPAPDAARYMDPDLAYARCLAMEDAGAQFLELASETLRPGLAIAAEEEQLHRVVPVLKRLRGKVAVPIIVRTTRAAVAERVIEYGVEILHDPSALTVDATIANIAATSSSGLILSHMRGAPEGWSKQPTATDPLGIVQHDLLAAVHRATRVNVPKGQILVDPGLSLGKRREENAVLLARLAELSRMDVPIAVHLDAPALLSNAATPGKRDTEVAATAAILAGAYLVAAFDFPALSDIARAAETIYAGSAKPEPEPEPAPARPRFRR